MIAFANACLFNDGKALAASFAIMTYSCLYAVCNTMAASTGPSDTPRPCCPAFWREWIRGPLGMDRRVTPVATLLANAPSERGRNSRVALGWGQCLRSVGFCSPACQHQ